MQNSQAVESRRLRMLGDYVGAEEQARRGLASVPGSSELRVQLALALKCQERLDEAREALQAASSLPWSDTQELCQLAELLLMMEQRVDALALLRAGAAEQPNDWPLVQQLAPLLLEDDAHAELLKLLEPHAARAASNPALLENLIAAYEGTGAYDRAVEYARRWVMVAPLDPYAHFKLAELEQRQGQMGVAMGRYRLVCELAQGDEGLREAAEQSMESLDLAQLQQIAALAAANVVFRTHLRRDREAALEEHGFQLTDDGLAVLSTVDLDKLSMVPGSADKRMSH